MTQERAKYIVTHPRLWGATKYSFPDKWRAVEYCDPDGITPEEDADVKALWSKMPGYTCYYDALCEIANGRRHLYEC